MGRDASTRVPRRWQVAGLALLGLVVLIAVYLSAHAFWTSSQTVAETVPGETKPWKLEVVNGTSEAGLGQRVADHLRRLGYDVVDVRTQRFSGPMRTAFVDRSGSPGALSDLEAVLELTPDRFRSELDRTLFLDVTVVVGSDLRTIPAFAAVGRPN